MLDKATELIKTVRNPISNKTLFEENRIQEIKFDNDNLVVKYDREGISPENKKIIEENILKTLSSFMDENKVSVITYSKNSQDVYQSLGSAPTAKPVKNESESGAQLKIGHGTVGNKRSIVGVKKVIAVASGKGGVGKSTFTVNLAVTLASMGKKVGVIDADIYGPSVPMLLGKRDEKPKANADKKIIPIDAYNLKFISFGLFVGENEPVIWRGPMLGGVLNQFLFDVQWGELDYLILDLPPGTGDIQLSMIQNVVVDGAIIISTPQDVALLDAKKGLQMFTKLNLPIVGMVENMSSFICDSCNKEHFIFGHGGVEKSVKELNVPFLGSIPLELALREGSDSGKPYMTNSNFKDKHVWIAYSEIARNVASFFEEDHKKSESLWKKLFK
jgi:ATP-binding protein involved in chromosome partitioning